MPARYRKQRTRVRDVQSQWLTFSDLLSAVLLVFVMFLLYSMYQYYNMSEVKTRELAVQAGLLDEQSKTLEESQQKLTASEQALINEQLKLEATKKSLDELKAEYELNAKELDTARALLGEQQAQLNTQVGQMNELQARLDAQIGVRAEIIAALGAALKNAGINVVVDANSGAIAFDSNVLFDVGQSVLKQEGLNEMANVVPIYMRTLLEQKNFENISEIIIEGHTDSTGSFMTNLKLSQDRAFSVASYVLGGSFAGLSEGEKARLQPVVRAMGCSFSNLVRNADGSENSDASRRVVFKFRLKTDEIDAMRNLLEGAGANTAP